MAVLLFRRSAHLLLEDLSLLEDLFHGHTADDDSRLTFDDPFNDILDMASLSRSDR